MYLANKEKQTIEETIQCPECKGSGQIQQRRQTILGVFATTTICSTCKGKGEIRWVQQNESTDVSGSAGLTFIDRDTMKIVKKHLLNKGEKLLHLSGF